MDVIADKQLSIGKDFLNEDFTINIGKLTLFFANSSSDRGPDVRGAIVLAPAIKMLLALIRQALRPSNSFSYASERTT
jgi:hypothetical protein